MWSLKLAVDYANPDPNKKYAAALAMLSADPAATGANWEFSGWLRENDEVAGLFKCLFDRDITIALFRYNDLLSLAFEDSPSPGCVRLVLDHFARSIANHNEVYSHNAAPRHQLSQFETYAELMPLMVKRT